MAEKGDNKKFWVEASAILKGQRNATGKAPTIGNRSTLASALSKGNATKRNAILGRFMKANGAPAAAAVAAGAAVAAAAAPNAAASVKVTEANTKAAKAALNAALAAAGTTRKASIAYASKYAKLLKNGNAAGAKGYLNAMVTKATEKGAEAAAAAAVKAAKANLGMNDVTIKNMLQREGVPAGVVNIAVFKKALAAGKTQKNAVNTVRNSRKAAAVKSAATRKASAAAKAVAAVNAAGAAGATLVAPAKTAKKAVKSAAVNKYGKVMIGANLRQPLMATRNKRNYGSAAPGRLPTIYNVAGSPSSRRNRKSRRNRRN